MAHTLAPGRAISGGNVLRILLVLIALDIAFLIVHASHVRFDVPGSGLWLISRDRGFPELYQYLKEAALVVMLLALFRTRRSAVYAVWALAFCYLLIDDSLELHETLGEELAGRLGLGSVLAVDARDLGQVLFSIGAGAVLAGLIAAATIRDRSEARTLSLQLLPVAAALAFFGVVTDAVDAIDLFGIVEDGGEMITMSVAVGIVVLHRPVRHRKITQKTP